MFPSNPFPPVQHMPLKGVEKEKRKQDETVDAALIFVLSLPTAE